MLKQQELLRLKLELFKIKKKLKIDMNWHYPHE